MNNLKIKLNPYKDINIASIGKKPLSPYSEINNYMKEPFLKWADKLFDTLERELNDDYNLTVIGGEFEGCFLIDMKKNFPSCLECSLENYQLNYSISERFDMIIDVAKRYGVDFSSEHYRVPIYAEIPIKTFEKHIRKSSIEDAKVIIANSSDILDSIERNDNSKIIIVKSKESCIKAISGKGYLWEVEEERIEKIVNILIERFSKIPLIKELASELDEIKESLSTKDIEIISLATEINTFLSVNDVGEIEVGDTKQLIFKKVPSTEDLPPLRITTSNSNILSIEGTKIKALAVGKAVLEFYKEDELISFAKKEITTFKNNYIENIDISISHNTMTIGEIQNLEVTLTPSDADDKNDVKFTVNNDRVIKLINGGQVLAKEAGRAVIKVESKNVKRSIVIEVLPNISNITLSTNKINLYVGETKEIKVKITPSNCGNKEYEWRTSDRYVAILEKNDEGVEVVRATGIGNCLLICKAKEGNCQSVCNVNIESTFNKSEKGNTWLSVTSLCMLAVIFLGVASINIGVYLGCLGTLTSGVLAIKENKNNWFWVVLLVMISCSIALLCLGII